MPQFAVVKIDQLDDGLVLTPERYDLRRNRKNRGELAIIDIAEIVNEQLNLKKGNNHHDYLVLDTSDASDGLIIINKPILHLEHIKSAKKIIRPGDVIISRLRPYLRQIAYVDQMLLTNYNSIPFLVCSTEFYVLRSRNEQSIAFLVPVLLSNQIQEVLAFSQEGGHHPRFSQSTLQKIEIPKAMLEKRDEVSKSVEQAVDHARQGDLLLKSMVAKCSEGI